MEISLQEGLEHKEVLKSRDLKKKNAHMCPKDLVSNRNISNILEESPPLRNKLEFGEPQASGKSAPAGA